jgi:hypothetical protein
LWGRKKISHERRKGEDRGMEYLLRISGDGASQDSPEAAGNGSGGAKSL